MGTDDFSFKPLIGLSVFGGFRPADKWRADIELSYIGTYHESETENYELYLAEKSYFEMVTYNFTVNGYYEFYKGFYAGVGTGLAIVNTQIEHSYYQKQTNTNISPMGALMVGWSARVDDKVDFDARCRVALYHGGDVKIADVKSEEGLITDFSLSAGMRYNF